MTSDDVIYHGYQPAGGGPALIAVETTAGDQIGTLANAGRRKSPDGFQWGYLGSGPAATARSLLVAALGEEAARCPECAGAQKVVYVVEEDAEAPYDAAKHGDIEPQLIFDCMACEDGIRRLPYQQFKETFVAGWSGEWRMARSDILAWLNRRGAANGE